MKFPRPSSVEPPDPDDDEHGDEGLAEKSHDGKATPRPRLDETLEDHDEEAGHLADAGGTLAFEVEQDDLSVGGHEAPYKFEKAVEPKGVPGGPQNAAPAPRDGTVSLVRTRTTSPTTALGVTQTVAEESHRVPMRVTE